MHHTETHDRGLGHIWIPPRSRTRPDDDEGTQGEGDEDDQGIGGVRVRVADGDDGAQGDDEGAGEQPGEALGAHGLSTSYEHGIRWFSPE